MRIVGGKWRGRKLTNLYGNKIFSDLRPTMDRVRETMFNILEHGLVFDIKGSRALDLFCGTGALGFEALSRGAESGCFIDSGKFSLNIVRNNKVLLEINREVVILEQDLTRLTQNTGFPYNLVFLDPPYGQSLGERAIRLAIKKNWISRDAVIVWEEREKIFPPEEFQLIKTRPIGNSCLSFFKRCN